MALLFAAMGSTGGCPAPARLEELVTRLTTASQRATVGGWSVERVPGGVVVSLRSSSGVTVQQRTLPAQDCESLARTSAVVLAAWLSEAPVVALAPVVQAEAPAPAAPEPPQPRAPLATRVEAPQRTSTVVVAAPPSAGWSVSLAARLELETTSLSPGVGLRVEIGNEFAGFTEVSTGSGGRRALGAGQVTWQRIPVGLGARWRFVERPTLFADLAMSGQAAALWMSSAGFASSTSRLSADAAGCATVSAGLQPGAVGVDVGLRGCVWAFDTTLAIAGRDERIGLPRAELGLLLGVRWKVR